MIDYINALGLAQEYRAQDGGLALHKANDLPAFGSEVARVMYAGDGTYRLDMTDPLVADGSISNIYEQMAADTFAPNGNMLARINAAKDYTAQLRSGVVSLAAWLDKNYELALYRVVHAGSGNKVGTLTIDPDLVIDEVTGMTAREGQLNRDRKALRGQLGAAYKRQARAVGAASAMHLIRSEVDAIVGEDRLRALADHSG